MRVDLKELDVSLMGGSIDMVGLMMSPRAQHAADAWLTGADLKPAVPVPFRQYERRAGAQKHAALCGRGCPGASLGIEGNIRA